MRKAKFVPHHDDPPCEARLLILENGGRYCPKCGLAPDTQSTCLRTYCPDCDEILKNMRCKRCGKTFQVPNW